MEYYLTAKKKKWSIDTQTACLRTFQKIKQLQKQLKEKRVPYIAPYSI